MDHRANLVVLLRQRLETLVDAMPAAQGGDVKSVHQARVATRRLREAFPVLRKSLDTQAIDRAGLEVRRMTRALGPVRELDVALLHLDEYADRGVVTARAINRVRQSILDDRLACRRQMLHAITPGKVEKLRRHLHDVGSGPPVAGRPAAVRQAARQVARRARKLIAAIEHAGSLYLAERLHAVRIAAKKLRYAMEIQRELTRSRVTSRIRQLKTLQDLLGRMHDLQVLEDRTRRVQAGAAATDRRLAADLDELLRVIEEDCRRQHALYMRRRTAILKLCAHPNLNEEPRPSAA